MRSTSVVFSFLFFLASTASAAPFQPWAIKLFSDSEEAIRAKTELAKMSDLDQQLQAAIVSGGREQMLAFRVMGALERVKLVPWLIERTRSLDPQSEDATLHLTALASMCETSEAEKIITFVNQYIDLKDTKIPTLSRLAVLTAWDVKRAAPPLAVIDKLLSDDDAQIRQKAMEVFESYHQGDSSDLVVVLKKALTLSPFPLRMRAANMAAKLNKTKREPLMKELHACSKDSRPEVESACKSALSAP